MSTLARSAPSQYFIPAAIGTYGAAIALAPGPVVSMALAAPLAILPLLWWTIQTADRWRTLFFTAALLLPPLPIALGNSGPHPALLAAALGLFIALLRLEEWRLTGGPVVAPLIAYFGIVLCSVSLAAVYSGVEVAAGSLARVMLFGIAVFVFLYTLNGPRTREDNPMGAARVLFWLGVAAAIFACVDFYFQFPAPAGYGPQFIWLESGVFRRAQGLFYEASTLGNLCAFFLVMIAISLFQRREERVCSRPALIAAGVVFLTALIFSYSRGSLLNVAIAMLALAYLRGVRLRRLLAAGVVCATAGIAAVYWLFPAFAHSYWMRLSASFEYFWSAPEGVLSGRIASWRFLSDFISNHPWHLIAGIGYKTLPYSEYAGRAVIADNMYLSLLVETGLIGLLTFLTLNAAILRSSLRAARSASPRAAFFGAWIFCFWIGEVFQMFSGDLLTYWRVVPLYFWALAVAIRENAPAT